MKKTRSCPFFVTALLLFLSQQHPIKGQSLSDLSVIDSLGEMDQNNSLNDLKNEIEKEEIDINECSVTALSSISFLLPEHIDAIIAHRRNFGPFASVYELQAVRGLPRPIAKILQAYITCHSYGIKSNSVTPDVEKQNMLSLRLGRGLTLPLQPDSGAVFTGTPWSMAVRSRIMLGKHTQVGVFLEKDAGEPFLWRGKYKQSIAQRLSGFDHVGFTFLMNTLHKRLPTMIIGAYTLCLGQGLLMWQGFPLGKGSSSMAIQKLSPVLRPKFAPSEGQNMQGMAMKWLITQRLHCFLFTSLKGQDALITTDTLHSIQSFSAMDVDGYHRTETEMANRNSLLVGHHGVRLHHIIPNANVGINTLYTHFSAPLIRSPALYRQFLFEGKHLLQGSIDYRVQTGYISLFGEHAMSSNAASAHLTGLQISLHRTLDVGLYFRNFSRNYQTLTGNTPGESSLPINESGYYTGLEWRPSTQFIINAYSDMWKHPWAGYQRSGPATGHDFLLRIMWRKKRWGEAYVQYKKELKLTDSDVIFATPSLIPQQTSHLRVHFQCTVATGWQWRCRAEWSFYRTAEAETEKGFLVFQDLIYKSPQSGWSVTARLAFFDINGFGARIYSYEHDVLFTASIPFLQGQGTRCYILLRKKWAKMGSTELRWSADKVLNTGNEAWASGLTNTVKSELTIQWSQRF